MVPLSPVFFKPFCSLIKMTTAAKTRKRMLEYWYKEKRTLVDFRRGPLGEYFDGFAAHLKAKGYSYHFTRGILGKCCQFNAFLIEQGILHAAEISKSLIDAFLKIYHAPMLAVSARYSPKIDAQHALKYHLFAYLVSVKALAPPKPNPIVTPYTWLLDPYLRSLGVERELSEKTVKFHRVQLNSFLDGWGHNAKRERLKTLTAETVEKFVREHFRKSTASPVSLAGVLRQFFQYCARHRYMRADFSGLIPSVRSYRHASLPKGMADDLLESMLKVIPKDTPVGARDYAIIILMMAYGIRAISAAQLLLDDIDWHHSKIRICAQKGGKEVMLPLMEPVGEAMIQYLKHRRAETPFREVFLSVKAPFQPLNSSAITRIVQERLKKAGIKIPGSGTRTLRHSWAIRALASNSPIKAIADVLGHRYIDTTFIYAKANLNSLREVALPWPEKS
jgi:site-specific recombinase XerD